MAAGVIQTNNGASINVSSNSCANVKTGVDTFNAGSGYVAQSCSADPVVAGTVITIKNASNQTATFTVTSITATASSTSTPANSITCSGACTVTLELSLPPLQLASSEGALIAGAVLAVWAVGYGFRALIRTLSIDGNSLTSESET